MTELRKFDEPIELQRLRKLQILIETDMWFNKNIELDMTSWRIREECGTTACLCGMYSMVYPEDGLGTVIDEVGENELGPFIFYNIVYGSEDGFSATAAFFGLAEKENTWLFCGSQYDLDEDVKAVALRRVKSVIGEKVACLN